MPATFVYGRDFQVRDTTDALGEAFQEVVGIDGGDHCLNWTSVRKMREVAERHGVSKEIWPVYPDIHVEIEVPLKNAQRRSEELRCALERVDPRVIEEDNWLKYIITLLRDGHSFFIMV